MNVKFYCSICGNEIKSLSIVLTGFKFRRDMTVVNSKNNINPFLVECDREYFDGKVESIIYDCPSCVSVQVTENVDDFLRDGNISYSDLNHNQYGSLMIKVGKGDKL